MSARTASNASTEIAGAAASGNDVQTTSSSIQKGTASRRPSGNWTITTSSP